MLCFPEIYTRKKLNEQYRAIPLEDRVHVKLRKYCSAMANLYGIISLQKAFEIISEQCRNLVTKTDFLAFCEIARHECEEYVILSDHDLGKNVPDCDPMDRKIIDRWLVQDNIDFYSVMLHSHFGKPYYIPLKTKLLAYADPLFCENKSDAAAVLTSLKVNCHLSAEAAENAFEELLFSVRCIGADLQQVIRRLQKLGANFENSTDINQFIDVYSQFSKSARSQLHRGWTAAELSSRPELFTISPTKKIGRNDPCPCGSGKKYKNCCGR